MGIESSKYFYVESEGSEDLLSKVEEIKCLVSYDIPRSYVPLKTLGKIIYNDLTTSEAIRRSVSIGRIAALNFANAVNPGGGNHNGMGPTRTQEEHLLALSPDAYKTIKACRRYYPLYSRGNRALYFSKVHLEKYDDLSYAKTSIEYDMMVAPALDMTNSYNIDKLWKYTFEEMIDHYMRPMLNNLFIEAIYNGCSVVILGDWGCGVFAPKFNKQDYCDSVRKMMRETSEKFLPYVKYVIFAVPNFG